MNEYTNYPTISTISKKDMESYFKTHISIISLVQKLDRLEEKIKYTDTLEQTVVELKESLFQCEKKIEFLEQKIIDLENGQEHKKTTTIKEIGETVQYDNGVYVGEIVNNIKHGYGKYTWKNGDIYDGTWVDDHRTGYGWYSWANGDVYEGDFVDDKRTGKGKFTWSKSGKWAGDVYEGKYLNGVRDGKGIYTCANGRVYECEFNNGICVSQKQMK